MIKEFNVRNIDASKCIIVKSIVGKFAILDDSQKDENGLSLKIALADTYEEAKNYIKHLKDMQEILDEWCIIHEDFA